MIMMAVTLLAVGQVDTRDIFTAQYKDVLKAAYTAIQT